MHCKGFTLYRPQHGTVTSLYKAMRLQAYTLVHADWVFTFGLSAVLESDN